ncbi:Very-long-chain (3R)-3-hydroxyacyl-CoA dehydratase PASTICCINO 2 [Gonapodya sp. JEL0774]|nr:Very-long-chain (3R)-3-hydroxyacyl-CoA dehydratase PASTICCINO 2 [Gonapodya sp. JEL0774]
MSTVCFCSQGAAAYLCTPTDVHVITPEAAKASRDNYNSFGVSTLFKYLPGMPPNYRKPIRTDDNKKDINYVNGIVDRQGPNYALAKRIQHWRAMVARWDGCIVSSNIAPSTSTVSVTHNRLFALAYGGMHNFKPMEVFAPETSNAVMAALLINDVRNPNSVAHPTYPLDNPIELFREGSFHGGVWRTAFPVNAIGTPSALIYLASQPAVIAGLGVWAAWITFLVATAPN